MNPTCKTALLAAMGAALAATPALARQGLDDPAGHVRQENRQPDRAIELRTAPGADRATASAKDVRQARGADDAPGHMRGHGADEPNKPHN